MVSSGVPALDRLLGGDGYPDGSSILIIGAPGIGKEALSYWFIRAGLTQGDYCLYSTYRRVSDILKDMKGVGIGAERVPEFIAGSGSTVRCDLRDLTSISFNLKEAVHRNDQKRARVATDVLSPLLVLNPVEAMFAYWSQLLSDLKQQENVILALAEDGMHPPNTLSTIEQLFDGVIEMRLYEKDFAFTPLLRIKKMLGLPPLQGYFEFSITDMGMEVVPHVK